MESMQAIVEKWARGLTDDDLKFETDFCLHNILSLKEWLIEYEDDLRILRTEARHRENRSWDG